MYMVYICLTVGLPSSRVAGHPSIYVLGGHHHWFNVLGMHNPEIIVLGRHNHWFNVLGMHNPILSCWVGTYQV